jgi:hypothetical protein
MSPTPKNGALVYKYETPTGCKLFLKSGRLDPGSFCRYRETGSCPTMDTKIMEELSFFQAALDNDDKNTG